MVLIVPFQALTHYLSRDIGNRFGYWPWHGQWLLIPFVRLFMFPQLFCITILVRAKLIAAVAGPVTPTIFFRQPITCGRVDIRDKDLPMPT
jgi:hypothetical protein